jgi:hypothetical protein
MGNCQKRPKTRSGKIGSRSRMVMVEPEPETMDTHFRNTTNTPKAAYRSVMHYTCTNPNDLSRWELVGDGDPAWDTDAASSFGFGLGLGLGFSFGGIPVASYPVLNNLTMSNIGDPAFDSDSCSRPESENSAEYSESSFGSFSGPGCLSDSCSSRDTDDDDTDVGTE